MTDFVDRPALVRKYGGDGYVGLLLRTLTNGKAAVIPLNGRAFKNVRNSLNSSVCRVPGGPYKFRSRVSADALAILVWLEPREAIGHLESERAVLDLAIAKLKAQQDQKPLRRKPAVLKEVVK